MVSSFGQLLHDCVAAERALVKQLPDLITRCPVDAVQHGDFTAENLVLDRVESLAVIDREHLFRGGSPLHDLFTLFVSFMLGDAAPVGPAHFEAVFFGKSFRQHAFRGAFQDICRALSISASAADAMPAHFLLLGFHQLKARHSPLAKDHTRFLASALRQGKPPRHA
jgi:aminoglycoside phosphotransferase (APT) family kinase protein